MLRSARLGNSLLRRGVVAATAVLTGAVMTVAALATGASATDGSHGHGDRDGSQSQSSSSPGNQQGRATGAYVYRKRDASLPASWENSTQQYLVATWSGGEYRDVTVDQVRTALAAKGIALCGGGWGVQEDQAYGTEALFTGTPAPSYPKATIGWPPIFAAQHWSLEKFFETPACGSTATPSAAATSTPVVAPTRQPSSAPTATHTPCPTHSATAVPTQASTVAPVPAVTVAPTAEASVTPAPTVSPAQNVVSAVLAAPDSTQTAAPAVVSAVLAAGTGSGALAQTGAAPIGIAVAAVLLLVAGGVLLLLRRRNAMR